MNNRKAVRIVFSILIIGMLMFYTVGLSYAATTSELNQQQAEIESQIEETNSEIAGVQSQMTTALNQINELNTQISSYENDIEELQAQIDTLNAEIEQREASIAEQEQKYAEQKELLDKRLVALYETGTTTYLDMLLSSDGLADFISKYYMISQIAEYDEELLENILNIKTEIENEKASLEADKAQIEANKSEIEQKTASLSSSVSAKNALVSNLSDEEAALQEQLEEFENDKKEIQKQLAALAAKSSVTTAVAPSAAGYISPLAGKTKSNITTGYGAYSGHTGVDFACSAGTSILAVKSGTVVISTALRRSDGTYKSYGEYVVIDHGDGTMTLYAHMLSGSRTVSVGDTVSQGQVIGQVGSTGNSTGNHLHFEVRIGGKPVNPTQYLP